MDKKMRLSTASIKSLTSAIEKASRNMGGDNVISSIILEGLDPSGDKVHRQDMIDYLGALCVPKQQETIGQLSHTLNKEMLLVVHHIFGGSSWHLDIPAFKNFCFHFVCRFDKDMQKDINYPFSGVGYSRYQDVVLAQQKGEVTNLNFQKLTREEADIMLSRATEKYGLEFIREIGFAAMKLLNDIMPGIPFLQLVVFMSLVSSAIITMKSTGTMAMALGSESEKVNGSLIIGVSDVGTDPNYSNSSLILSRAERNLAAFKDKMVTGETQEDCLLEGIWISHLKMPGYQNYNMGHID